MNYVLQTNNLVKEFNGIKAVDHVSIEISKGEIYGFIGENGAGKTTFMRMVCGLAAPTEGSITLFESNNTLSQRYRVGCTIENPALYPTMTAMENIETQRLLLGIKDKSVSGKLLGLVNLSDTGKKKAKDFSLGMKQRLMIALSLLGAPEFLVLDEPANGLDPMGIKEMRDLFQHLNKELGITILISSHILGELEKIATNYGIISKGKMVDEIQTEELNKHCGKNLLINVSNTIRAKEIIRQMFSDVQFEQSPENSVRIKGYVSETGHINKQLVNAGITVNSLVVESENLENYFFRLMGGRKDD